MRAAGCLLALNAVAQLGTELIPNNGLARLDARGWPEGWPQGRDARIESDASGSRLVCAEAGSGVNFKIPLKPEYGRLKLVMQMKVTEVAPGKESWSTGRLTMSFHNAEGERIGPWPNVFGMTGTRDWTACERIYPIPEGAAFLSLSPCNLGASGTVEFRDLSLTVCRLRALTKADAPLPAPGGRGLPVSGLISDEAITEVWSLDDAWRQATPTRERVCLNGLWGFRPVLSDETVTAVPPAGDCWGWFKVPGLWPHGQWEPGSGVQQVWLAPWLEERGGAKDVEQAWYRRRFAVPKAWEGRRLALEFTMLQTHAQAFVDGRPCGGLWYPGGELELTGHLRPGAEQELALLVTARPLTAERNAFMAPDRIVTEKASVKHKGITGDLYLNAMPAAARLEDVQVIASVKEMAVTFAAETAGLGAGPWRLRAEVFEADGAEAVPPATPGGRGPPVRVFESDALAPDAAGVLRFTAPWPDAKTWDTDTPQNRYAVTLTLADAAGRAVDTLPPATFGFREIRIAGREFLLNGTPIHLRALHNTSANGGADQATASAARELCRRMFEYGFNALIGGNYDFAPGSVGYLDGLLEACDETGMLMAFSLPHVKDFGNRLDKPEIAELYRRQTAWLVRRARNHPSVIFYAMNHNSTGYYGDQNPQKIDGVYEIPEVESSKNAWWERNRRQARIADAIAKALDPARPVYHHQSGNLGDMHTVNCYLNWAPVQERSDWLGHWAERGVKPLFFVEWGLPHISSWSSYRGPQFIWRCEAFQSLWAAEFAAQFWGDAAYLDGAAAVRALDHEEALWAAGKPFRWGTLNAPLRDLPQNYQAVQAHFADDNWRSHRAWGVSAMLPWDQGDFWKRVARTEERPTPDVQRATLKCPGIVPDRIQPGNQYIQDLGPREAFVPTEIGRSMLRWNMPDCAFIGGPADAFTSKDHLFAPGAGVRKSLVVLNDRRRAQTVAWTWRLWRGDEKLTERQGSVRVAPGGRETVPVSFAFPERARDGERFRLTAAFDFEGGATQADEFSLHAVEPPRPPRLAAPVQLYDPRGLTARLFERLGVRFAPFDGARAPDASALVVIGREALDAVSAPWLAGARDGLRVLVFEQTSGALEGIGFRIAERGSRRLFPRFAHPATRGLDAAFFRDWSGAATLLPPYLPDLPEAETHDPLWKWSGFTNTRVWRCGNRGNVASVLIEKPARGDWRALVDGEFDLQYAALLECAEGRGRVVFCQLDVTGRTADEPAADRLVVKLLEELDGGSPRRGRAVAALGKETERLLRDAGGAGAAAGAEGRLLVVGPGAGAPPPDIFRAVEGGMNLLCLGLSGDELKAWCPMPVATVRTNACFTRIENLPPELNGLGNADWAWHGRMAFDALAVPESERDAASPALRVIRHGKGRVVLWQVPPWMIDEKAKPYLRTSKRRANAMAARLLANLGAELRAPLGGRPPSVYLDTPETGDDPYRYYRW
jgi:hypothetical protein